MKIKNIFFDANIFNDIFDKNRPLHTSSSKAFIEALKAEMQIYTSCDVITNFYYVTTKYVSKEKALDGIELLKTSVNIIPFGEKELSQTVKLMRSDADYKDLEDTLQYILALNTHCDVILSNDKKFVSKKIECIGSEIFIEKYLT